MKTLFVIPFLFFTLHAFGQKKLITYEYRQFDENMNIQQHDSISWQYNTWKGSIYNFEPKFDLFDFNFEFDPFATFIPYDSYLFYKFPSNSPSIIGSNFQTFTNGLLTELIELSGMKYKYEYDASGNQFLKNTFYSNGSSGWIQTGAMTQDFDQFGNILVRTYYQTDTTGPKLSVDSMTYIPGTFLLSSQTSFQYDLNTNTVSPWRKNEMTYLGSEIQEIDYFFSNGIGGLNFKYRYVYSYSGNTLSNYKRLEVVNGIPDSTVYFEKTFQYNGMNQLTKWEKTKSNDTTLSSSTFEYDADGFMIKNSYFLGNSTTPNNLQLTRELRYSFANTANIVELIEAKVIVFPNPTTDFLTITTEGYIKSLAVYNMNGQLLLQQNVNEINVRHLPAGNYVLKGETNKGVFTEKFVKR